MSIRPFAKRTACSSAIQYQQPLCFHSYQKPYFHWNSPGQPRVSYDVICTRATPCDLILGWGQCPGHTCATLHSLYGRRRTRSSVGLFVPFTPLHMSFKNPNCTPFTLWRASDVMELLLKSQPIAEPGDRCRCSSTRVARNSIHPLRGNDVSILTPSSFFWPMAEPQTSIQVVAPLHVSKFSASLPHLPYFLLADGIGGWGGNTPCPHFWVVMYPGLCPANIWGFCHSSSRGKLLTRNPPATFTISRTLLYLSRTTPLMNSLWSIVLTRSLRHVTKNAFCWDNFLPYLNWYQRINLCLWCLCDRTSLIQ